MAETENQLHIHDANEGVDENKSEQPVGELQSGAQTDSAVGYVAHSRARSRFHRWIEDQFAVDPARIEELRRVHHDHPGSRVVYVVRHPSWVLRKIFKIRCAQLGLPVPEHDDFGRQLGSETVEHGMLALRRRLGDELFSSQRRLKSIFRSTLRSAQEKQRSRSTIFIPVTFLAGRGPRPLSLRIPFAVDFSFLPLGEIWTALVLLVYRKELKLVLAKPYAFPGEKTPEQVIRSLSRALYRDEKAARGAPTHELNTVEGIVLSGNQYERLVQEMSIKGMARRAEIEHLARKHFRAIEGRFNGFVVAAMRKLLIPLFERIFEGFEVHGIQHLKRAVRKAPVILLPCHRSHFDYLLITCALDRQQMALPYIAAGDNLNFFPVGSILRRCGAFFIRRKVTDDQLYKLILDRYLTYLVKQGQLIEFYIEGGRSRDGHLRRPRLGLLKYIVRTVLRGTRKDVIFLPVGISYERVAEDASLASELRGEKKKRESFRQFFSLREIYKKRFGPVVLTFGEGLSLRELIAGNQELLASGEKLRSSTLADATEKIALRAMNSIDSLLALSLSGLTAAAFLMRDDASVSRAAIIESIELLLSLFPHARNAGAHNNQVDGSDSYSYTPVLARALSGGDLNATLGRGLDELSTFGFLESTESGLRISGESKTRATYYKNTILTKILAPVMIVERLQDGACSEEELRAFVSSRIDELSSRAWMPESESIHQRLGEHLTRLESLSFLIRSGTSGSEQLWELTPLGLKHLSELPRLLQ